MLFDLVKYATSGSWIANVDVEPGGTATDSGETDSLGKFLLRNHGGTIYFPQSHSSGGIAKA